MIVGPCSCLHCDRPIGVRLGEWVHIRNGRPECYRPDGTKVLAVPRLTGARTG